MCQRWSRGVVDIEGGQGAESYVAIDASGAVALAGSFAGTVDLGGGDLTSASQQDIFIARYNPGGSLDWHRTFTPVDLGSVAFLHDVAVNPDGAVHIVGRSSYDIDLGGGVETVTVSNGSWDFFVAEYGADGEFLWSAMFGQSASELGRYLALDSQDNIFVGGHFSGGSLDLGGGAMDDLARALCNAQSDLQARTGIAGRFLRKADDPWTWMEIYENVTDVGTFDDALKQAIERHGLQRFADEGACRHTERFIPCA